MARKPKAPTDPKKGQRSSTGSDEGLAPSEDERSYHRGSTGSLSDVSGAENEQGPESPENSRHRLEEIIRENLEDIPRYALVKKMNSNLRTLDFQPTNFMKARSQLRKWMKESPDDKRIKVLHQGAEELATELRRDIQKQNVDSVKRDIQQLLTSIEEISIERAAASRMYKTAWEQPKKMISDLQTVRKNAIRSLSSTIAETMQAGKTLDSRDCKKILSSIAILLQLEKNFLAEWDKTFSALITTTADLMKNSPEVTQAKVEKEVVEKNQAFWGNSLSEKFDDQSARRQLVARALVVDIQHNFLVNNLGSAEKGMEHVRSIASKYEALIMEGSRLSEPQLQNLTQAWKLGRELQRLDQVELNTGTFLPESEQEQQEDAENTLLADFFTRNNEAKALAKRVDTDPKLIKLVGAAKAVETAKEKFKTQTSRPETERKGAPPKPGKPGERKNEDEGEPTIIMKIKSGKEKRGFFSSTPGKKASGENKAQLKKMGSKLPKNPFGRGSSKK